MFNDLFIIAALYKQRDFLGNYYISKHSFISEFFFSKKLTQNADTDEIATYFATHVAVVL